MKYQKITSIVILASILLVSCNTQTQGGIKNTSINDFEELCKKSDEQTKSFYLEIAPKVAHLPKNKQKEFFERRERLKKRVQNKNINKYYKKEQKYFPRYPHYYR
ncbi:hypothetical protein GS16_01995 [Candidatus Liberibacter solanacearum]|uniref:Lipoprotein n=1 Tax=Candidatus Liberibacter solanacearum TaxID=556287 RepID=A0A094Z0M9_9HYPH|nr:hypothetical protein [Candidatus Liberibacter solanacearum]KGB27735.1 hypothetical protein GS16_01995 [Candidatus Liberibacter solanacearum]KJZ81437.1 hypothetical protein KP07_00700 [Candidatus Liberibacter solanacearum]KJZ82572.1 hypothetical protein DJ66_0180 [Candidatus Liberibacter solanacearum]KQC49074.1 hypothetical protein AP064_03165 [Candidatus Liberibacter solanacearum]